MLHGIAAQIARDLVLEMREAPDGEPPAGEGVVELLLERLAKNVEALLSEAGPGKKSLGHRPDTRLERALRKLERVEGLTSRDLPDDDDDDDDDDRADHGRSYPNLKYAKPKYNDVDSVLKYIERDDDDRGGVKLVIMNFND